ncbi:lipoprotein [Spirochaetia bacterium]|nr:lipoprotein [Spirochaetia bacterium]
MKKNLLVSVSSIVYSIFLFSCSEDKSVSVERVDLKTFDIGRLESEIDLYNLEGKRSQTKTAIKMRSGLFYISNGNGEKVACYNSYGDLLFMIYNDETNPPLRTLRTKTDNAAVTRWAYSWPLNSPGAIAVNHAKHIYVEDILPAERHSFDKEQKALLNSLVLHFDADGRFIEYLGQEGPGGTPFSRIEGIYSSANDEIAVVCRLPKGRKVYWFDAGGTLLYLIQILDDALPMPDNVYGLWSSLDQISVSPDERKLYLKIDYYLEIHDESTGTIAGREPASSYMWTVDAENGAYIRKTPIPFFESTTTLNNKKVTDKLLYSLFGVMNNALVFLYSPIEEGFSILILSTNGNNEQRRGIISVNPEELQFCTFDVSEEGILSALLADSFNVKLLWWRTDKLARDI